MKVTIKKVLLFVSIGLLATGFIFSITFNYILAPCTEHHFQIETNDPNFGVWGQNGTKIDVVMYQPKPEYDIYAENRPYVVLVHGILCDKTYMKGASYELCKRGFVAISITARGHGASGGQFASGVYFYNECLGVISWLRNHSADFKLDNNRIGITGHSMGAVTVTNAAVKDHELGNNWINCTVSVAGPVYNYTAGDPGRASADFGVLSRIFSTSPITFAFFYPQLYAYPNLYDIDTAMRESIIAGRVDNMTPYNYLNIIGELDEGFTTLSAREVVWNMGESAVFTDAPTFADLPSGKLYGAFNGSARKLEIVPGVDHLWEMNDPRILTCMIQWFENSMNIINSNPIIITEVLRMQSILFTILGICVSIIPFTIYVGDALRAKNAPIPKAAKEIEEKQTFKLFGLYGGIYAGVSFAVFPVILLFNLNYFIATDFLLSNIFILFGVVQAVFLLTALIVLTTFERKKYGETWEDFGLARKSLFKSVVFALILFAIYFVIGNLIATNHYHNMLPYKIGGFLEMLVYLLGIYFVNELFLRGLIQNKLERYRGTKIWKLPGKAFILGIVIPGLIQGLGMGIIFSMFMGYVGADILTVILVPFVFIIAYIGLTAIQWGLYRKSQNILGSTIFTAFFLAWIFSIVMPAIDTGLSFVFIL